MKDKWGKGWFNRKDFNIIRVVSELSPFPSNKSASVLSIIDDSSILMREKSSLSI